MLSVRRMLGREPRSATDQYNLGLEQLNSGAVSNAENSFRSALALKGDFPEAWVALAEALEAQGRDAEALTALDEAILHRHDYVGALTNASLLLRKMGRATDSQARAKAIDLVTQCAAGRSLELETLATQIVQELPKFGLAWKVMGAIAAKNRRFESALPALRQAASLLPSDPEAHHNFAIVLHTLAHMQEAEVAYRRAIALRSDYREAFSNLSNLLMTTGRLSDAEAACRQALDLDPLCFEAHSDMGNILGALGRPSEALISYRSALALKPDYHMAHANLGASLVALARLDEAEASCRRAVELKPDFPEGHHNLLFLLNYHPDKSPSEVFSAYRAFDARIGLPLHSAWRPHNNSREPARRLRVGYVSPDFRRHPARHFVEPLLEHHDKSKVEVFAYAQMAVEDEVTARMKTRVDHWVPTCGMTDVEMADRIRGDGIDVLVDLAGHTG